MLFVPQRDLAGFHAHVAAIIALDDQRAIRVGVDRNAFLSLASSDGDLDLRAGNNSPWAGG